MNVLTGFREDTWPYHLRPWLRAHTRCLIGLHHPAPYWTRRPTDPPGFRFLQGRPPDGWVCSDCGQKQPAPSSGS